MIQILITDYCNQNCPFCFARAEMRSSFKKAMTLKEFKFIINKAKHEGILRIALVGGEPMIHPQIKEILKLSLSNFIHIHINTNGIFNKNIEKILIQAGPRISLLFNVSTPGFIFNKHIRQLVMKMIKRLSFSCPTTIVITDKFINEKNAQTIINFFDKDLLKKIKIRLGVEGVVVGEKNFCVINDFKKIGNNLFKIYKYIEEYYESTNIIFSKSIVPCMFTSKQRKYLQKKGLLKLFHCHPRSENFWFSVTPSLEAFMCYPLSTIDRIKIDRKTSFLKLREYYRNKQKEHHKKYVLPECKKCPFFGLEENKCPGPCVSFKINALRFNYS